MKKALINIFKLSLAISLVFSFQSCEEDTDQWIYNGPALASFPNETTANFFVEDKADASFEVEVALNTVSGSDRTVSVSIDADLSTAIEGTHFNMPKTVTIPANEVIGVIEVGGIYASLPNSPLSLVINIEGDNVADYDNSYTLNLYKFVPFDIANFIGTFECTEISYFGEFTYDVELTQVEGTQSVEISGFGGGMEAAYGIPKGDMNPLVVNFITTTPSSYGTSMGETVAFESGGVPTYYTATAGELNTLNNSFTLGGFNIADAEGPYDIISGVTFTKK